MGRNSKGTIAWQRQSSNNIVAVYCKGEKSSQVDYLSVGWILSSEIYALRREETFGWYVDNEDFGSQRAAIRKFMSDAGVPDEVLLASYSNYAAKSVIIDQYSYDYIQYGNWIIAYSYELVGSNHVVTVNYIDN